MTRITNSLAVSLAIVKASRFLARKTKQTRFTMLRLALHIIQITAIHLIFRLAANLGSVDIGDLVNVFVANKHVMSIRPAFADVRVRRTADNLSGETIP